MSRATTVRIGTRGSALARWQAEWVAEQLSQRGVQSELVLITTRGDQKGGPIGSLGGTGVFTKAIQEALLDERIDVAVHSAKDLPTEHVSGLVLAAVPPRERCGDVLVSPSGAALAELPQASVIGTGSLRRAAQLKYLRSDVRVQDIRGNVETRLEKVDGGQYDAIILAEAGLVRLGLGQRITERLSPTQMLPAVGQGALALETRAGDETVRTALTALDDADSHRAVVAERSLLATLRGGCLAPIGAWGRVDEHGRLRLTAAVLDRDGTRRVDTSVDGPSDDAIALGREAAEQLLSQGAANLIRTARDRS
jgi:hydroxymethylbilane synthase